jgi:GcrA cell cycle regulator
MIKNDSVPTLPAKAADLVIAPKDRKTLRALKRNECRWPYGDPRQKDFYFCGKPRIGSSPYCEFHKRRAFQPTRQRDYRPYRPGMAA